MNAHYLFSHLMSEIMGCKMSLKPMKYRYFLLLMGLVSVVSWAGYASESADEIGRRQMQELDIGNRPSFSSSKASFVKNSSGGVTVNSGVAPVSKTSIRNTSNDAPYEIPKAGSHLDNFKTPAVVPYK